MSSFDDTVDRETPTVPHDHAGAGIALCRDPVLGLRRHGCGSELELGDRPRLVIGAGSRADLVVARDPYVSAIHCVLERQPGDRLLVRDRGSKNGTYINGNRIEIAELRVGAVLTVGRTGFVALGRRAHSAPGAREALVGADPAFRAALDQALVAAATGCSVLVIGETGTGKELVARAIHEASSRALGPFVALNCGAMAPELIGSELFGHERGAFTGAIAERDGVFAQADRGTLFLDELGELPRSQQPHLLRALETRRIRRVGGQRERSVDIRLVSATNRLELEGPSSPLRADLYHRVATLVVELPPLRQRPSDIPLLVASFLAELEPEFGRRDVPPELLTALCDYHWSGNVRELRHAVHRAVALSAHVLRREDLLPQRRSQAIAPLAAAVAPDPPPAAAAPAPAQELALAAPHNLVDAAMGRILEDAYRRHGSIRRAARALGMPRSTFADRIHRLKLAGN
jgi:transcriptional regulator with GAF, ATPase, and Fis domain